MEGRRPIGRANAQRSLAYRALRGENADRGVSAATSVFRFTPRANADSLEPIQQTRRSRITCAVLPKPMRMDKSPSLQFSRRAIRGAGRTFTSKYIRASRKPRAFPAKSRRHQSPCRKPRATWFTRARAIRKVSPISRRFLSRATWCLATALHWNSPRAPAAWRRATRHY